MKKITLYFFLLSSFIFFGTNTDSFLLEEKNRVAKDFEDNYIGTTIASFEWTGATKNCTAGTITPSSKNNALKRINYFRRLAGLNDNVVFKQEYDEQAQSASLLMFANNTLTHTPSKRMKCFSQKAYDGANHSNLAQLANNDYRHIIQDLMEDTGEHNKTIGHRKWLLNSSTTTMGFGANENFYAVHVTGDENFNDTCSHNFISWPPKGFVPFQHVFKRWNFSIPKNRNPDFAGASVTISANGKTIYTRIISKAVDFGDPAIVWEVLKMEDDFNYDFYNNSTKITALKKIGLWGKVTVTLKNVRVNGKRESFTYNVYIFDPTKKGE